MAHRDQWFGGETFSQHGEDLAILNLFQLMGREGKTYLDIGCHHPMNISNTFLLYTRGWRGVGVDPNGNLQRLWTEIRPRDTFVKLAVAGRPQRLSYAFIDEMSGRNSADPAEVARFVGENPQFSVNRTEYVDAVPISYVVGTYMNDVWPDLLTVDAEGFDLEILQHALFLANIGGPAVVCAEVRAGMERVFAEVMSNKGYAPWARFGENVLYVPKKELIRVRG